MAMVHLLLKEKKKKRHDSTILLPQATVRDYQIEQYLGHTYSKKNIRCLSEIQIQPSVLYCIWQPYGNYIFAGRRPADPGSAP